MSKDFQVTVRVRNGRVIHRMRELGIKTVAELSRVSGVDQQRIGLLLAFKIRPYLSNGEWSSKAFAISAALRCEPEDLWPEHIATLKTKKNQVTFDADIEQVQSIAAHVEKTDLLDRANIPKLLANLSARERKVVGARFGLDGGGEATIDAVAADLGVSRERARQIECKALRSMRDKLAKQRFAAAHRLVARADG